MKNSNEWHRLRENICSASNWLNTGIRSFLKPYGITQKQYNILTILESHKEELAMTILDVREKMIDRMSDASRIIDRLEIKGLILKKPCTMDKRANRVYLTDHGKSLLGSIHKNRASLDAITNRISLEEAKQLSVLLEKVQSQKLEVA